MQNEKERQTVEEIRGRYVKREEEAKLEKLRRLDASVRRPAEIFAYTFGTIAALILGVGMCLAMKVIGDLMPLGIAIGCIGIVMAGVNYFIYKAILNSRKKKYAASVAALSDELLGSEK